MAWSSGLETAEQHAEPLAELVAAEIVEARALARAVDQRVSFERRLRSTGHDAAA
jgi:hypothetical protein